jgi:hypothetical protein
MHVYDIGRVYVLLLCAARNARNAQVTAWLFEVDIRIFNRPYVNDKGIVIIPSTSTFITHRIDGDLPRPVLCVLYDKAGKGHYDALVPARLGDQHLLAAGAAQVAGSSSGHIVVAALAAPAFVPVTTRNVGTAALSQSTGTGMPLCSLCKAAGHNKRTCPRSLPVKRSSASSKTDEHASVGIAKSKRVKVSIEIGLEADIDDSSTESDADRSLYTASEVETRSHWRFKNDVVTHHMGPAALDDVTYFACGITSLASDTYVRYIYMATSNYVHALIVPMSIMQSTVPRCRLTSCSSL